MAEASNFAFRIVSRPSVKLFAHHDPSRESSTEVIVRRTAITLGVVLLLLATVEIITVLHRSAGLH